MIDDLKRLRDNYYEMYCAINEALRNDTLEWTYKDLQRLRTNCEEAVDRINQSIEKEGNFGRRREDNESAGSEVQ